MQVDWNHIWLTVKYKVGDKAASALPDSITRSSVWDLTSQDPIWRYIGRHVLLECIRKE